MSEGALGSTEGKAGRGGEVALVACSAGAGGGVKGRKEGRAGIGDLVGGVLGRGGALGGTGERVESSGRGGGGGA